MMVATPVARHQVHLPSIGLVKGRVIHDQQTARRLDVRRTLLPQRRRVGRLSMERRTYASCAGGGVPSGAQCAASVQVETR
jgi:hypothetical protein